MGVVRREGDWRIEKRGEGIYELTYQKNVELRLYTEDATRRDQMGFDGVPTDRVSDFHDVERVFEDRVRRSQTQQQMMEMDPMAGTGDRQPISQEDLPPGGFGLVLTIAGVLSLVWIYPTLGNNYVLALGGIMAAGGLAIFGYALYLFREEGLGEAMDFLLMQSEDAER